MLLPFAVAANPPVWAIWWLALCAVATYLFYVDGPYWSTVVVGWSGAAILLAAHRGDALLQQLMTYRARRKVGRLRPGLEILLENDDDARILDLGAGEGYVGAVLQQAGYGRVLLADVVDMNRTALPHKTVDGRTLPFEEDVFDVTVLCFVLHHARDPERVLTEALRVSKRGVIVMESTVSGPLQHRVLRTLDQLANRVRSQGEMNQQEDYLHLRSPEEWVEKVDSVGGTILKDTRIDGVVHPKLVLTLK
jgi:ubiquinone/menaquinone biosynthesis C-methylase UbiE